MANVKTIAGYSDIGIQLLEQAPYPIDQMIIQDLLADLGIRLPEKQKRPDPARGPGA